eukprot:7377006-Prymnesium_polylepis.1
MQAGDDVVGARALPAAEDDADGERRRHVEATAGPHGLQVEPRQAEGRGQPLRDEEFVGARVGGQALHDANGTARVEHRGEARHVGAARGAQRRLVGRLGRRRRLLVPQRQRRQVGRRPLELDRARLREGGGGGPAGALRGECGEGAAAEVDERLVHDGPLLALASLDAHHRSQRSADHAPLRGVGAEATHARHHARAARADERTRGEAERVAVVAIKVGGRRAAALEAEVVVLRRKTQPRTLALAATRAACGLAPPPRELLGHELAQQPLRLDLAHLHAVLRVAVEEQLALHRFGQEGEDR